VAQEAWRPRNPEGTDRPWRRRRSAKTLTVAIRSGGASLPRASDRRHAPARARDRRPNLADPDGADIRLRTPGLTSLVTDLRVQTATAQGGIMAERHPVSYTETVTVRVPISIRRRGGRKLVLGPDGTKVTTAPVNRHSDNAMVKARLRGCPAGTICWRAASTQPSGRLRPPRRSNESYVGRALWLTLLAPGIVGAVLSGRQPPKSRSQH
jgi:hypothetical protein